MEHDLEQQVPQLVGHVLRTGPVVGVQAVERVEDLVGLLQQVSAQRVGRLRAVPRALFPQRAHQLPEADELGPDRRCEARDPEAGEVVGLHGAVELHPLDGGDRLLGQAEALQHDHRLRRRVVHRQLDGGEDVDAVALAHQQRTGRARCLGREALAVDQAHPGRQRIDAEAGPGEVEEREGGLDPHLHPALAPQQFDRPFGHQRGAGHRVGDTALGDGLGHQPLDDRRVHALQRGRPLVHLVEAAMRAECRDRRVAPRADEASLGGEPLPQPPGPLGQQLDRAGPQADHHHLGAEPGRARVAGADGGGHGRQPVVVVGLGAGPTVVGVPPPPVAAVVEDALAPPDPASVLGVSVTPLVEVPRGST